MISLKKILTRLTIAAPPCGAISAYYGTTAPSGWLICDGSSFDTNKYSKLYELLGSNTLPDLRDKFLVGKSNSYSLGSTGGEAAVTLITSNLPSHAHPFKDGSHTMLWGTGNVYAPTVIRAGNPGSNNYISTWHGYWGDTGVSGSDVPHNNLPPYHAVTYIISTGGVI